MSELEDGSVQLMVTSPPYPMIAMWDELFARGNPKIAEFFRELATTGNGETVRQIYNAMHNYLSEV